MPRADSETMKKSLPKVKKGVSMLKKEEDDEDSEEPTSKKGSNKTGTEGQKKKKKMKAKGGNSNDFGGGKKREKKVFDLPGQKREPPDERDPLRIFYESLYNQSPTSEMAAIWMMESGLLPKDVAQKVFDRNQSATEQQKLSSPMKTVVTVKKKADDSVTIKKKSATSPVRTQEKNRTEKRRMNGDKSSNDDKKLKKPRGM